MQKLKPNISPDMNQSKHQNKAKSETFTNGVEKIIENELFSGELIIPQDEKPFKINRNSQRYDIDTSQRLKDIKQKKFQLKKQLEGVYSQEQALKASQVDRKAQKSRMKLHKSELTNEDAQNLKKLVKAHRRFQKQLVQKTQKYQERMKRIQQEQEQILRKKQIQMHQKKKKQLEKSLQKMEVKRQQQKERFEEQKRILKEQIRKKRMHEELKDKWREKEIQDQKQKTQIAQELRKMKLVDFQQIKEHSKKYQDTIKAQKQSRINIVASRACENTSFYYSSFKEAVLEQEQKKKQEEYQKKIKVIQFFEKRKAYGQQVRTNHKPLTKKSDKAMTTPGKQNSNKSLSIFQTHKKGNQYMKVGNSLISHSQQNEKNEIDKQAIKNRYKNYLAQLRSGNENKSQSNTDEALSSILNNKNLNEEQKIYKAKMLTQKIQSQNNNKNLMKSINAKIKLLKQLQN